MVKNHQEPSHSTYKYYGYRVPINIVRIGVRLNESLTLEETVMLDPDFDVQDVINYPENYVNVDLVRALAQALKDATSFDKGSFVKEADHAEVQKSKYFMKAMCELTERSAYSKGECALLIAEKEYRAEKLLNTAKITKHEINLGET